MKKLTRKSLDELAKTLPVIEEASQMHYVGGGDGTSIKLDGVDFETEIFQFRHISFQIFEVEGF